MPNYSGSDSSSSASASSSASTDSTSAPAETSTAAAATSTDPSSTTPATTASASVVTSVAPGKTVVVTEPASQDAGPTGSPPPATEDSKHHGGGTNVAGVAAGVVVGVLVAVALIAGLILWLRHKRRQAAEDEYKRSNQASDFLRGAGGRESKPPQTAYSNMSDSRLDPEAGRRDSSGSIADGQDYSRRILRVRPYLSA